MVRDVILLLTLASHFLKQLQRKKRRTVGTVVNTEYNRSFFFWDAKRKIILNHNFEPKVGFTSRRTSLLEKKRNRSGSSVDWIRHTAYSDLYSILHKKFPCHDRTHPVPWQEHQGASGSYPSSLIGSSHQFRAETLCAK